jgi:hypothetical protein
MGDEEADRAIAEVADEIGLNGRRNTRQTQAMHDDGATEMGYGRRPAAKCHSQGRFVSYAGSFADPKGNCASRKLIASGTSP